MQRHSSSSSYGGGPGMHTRYSSQSWISRMCSSVAGACVGVLVFAASFPLLVWNEGAAVQTWQSLDEGFQRLVDAPRGSHAVPDNEGGLVYVAGAPSSHVLEDTDFGLAVPALRLVREVEMFQWTERAHSRTYKDSFGNKHTETQYSYEPTWSSQAISSRSWSDQSYQNPTHWPVSGRRQQARGVQVGDFVLPGELIDKLKDGSVEITGVKKQSHISPPPSSSNTYQLQVAQTQIVSNMVLQGNELWSGNPQAPVVGDIRVRFRMAAPKDLSVVGMQKNGMLVPFQTQAGDKLHLIAAGHVSPQQLFIEAENDAVVRTWLLRVGGCVAMFVGLMMVGNPLTVAPEAIPCFGWIASSIVSTGLCLFAIILAVSLSLLTVALAWVAYRPVLAASLVAGAVALLYFARPRSSNAAGQHARND